VYRRNLHVIYRLCGIASTNPSPIYQDDKYKLNELCLKSFIEAYSDVRPEVIFLLDHCGDEYYTLLEQVPFNYRVEISNAGINATMLRAYELASELEDYVVLQECDYLYRGVIGKTYLAAMKDLGIVSPYDHPNFYHLRKFHREECRIKVVDNHHFRTAERNTMTWGCHSNIIKKHRQLLDRHGYLDGPVWDELAAEGLDLWVPVLSFATHMVRDCLAPGVDWKELWSNIQ
jgi:hypothetical protein